MGNFTYTLEKYNGLKTRYNCPECGGKNQFARYVDQEGNHVSDNVGRCNRESKCGYHLKPKEYFEKNSLMPDWNKRTLTTTREVTLPAQYISPDILKSTLQAYERNTFVKYLHTIFENETVSHLIDAYRLGTTRDGSCIFWQADSQGQIRTGKVIRYNQDGHRDKTIPPYFIHAKLKVEPIEQCLFGLHLLMVDHGPLGLVESEKTAVIMSGQLPDYTWVATGGKMNLSKVHALKGKKVVAFPDTDAFHEWTDRLSPYGFKISSALQKHITDPDHGYDLADFVQSTVRTADVTIIDKPYFETLNDGRVIEMHPAGYPLSWAV
ncbi:MAG: DUF6371 domain-containing protein [Cyclobacteriaceae bacterium]